MRRNRTHIGPGLRNGSSVSVIAPGMTYDEKALRQGIDILKKWGLRLEGPLPVQGGDAICSSPIEERVAQLNRALKSSSKIIWCARGGYGSLQLLSQLQRQSRPKNKKYLIGFSDISTLHQVWSQDWNWPSLHGPHLDRLSALSAQRLRDLKKFLFGHSDNYILRGLKAANAAAHDLEKLEGRIHGGNLITLQSTLGTPWQLNGRGKILFFEDIGERGYRVDRVLQHMDLCQVFRGVKAVVFGAFTNGNEPGAQKSLVPAAIENFSMNRSFPVFHGLRVGHIPQSLLLPLNTPARILRKGSAYHLEF